MTRTRELAIEKALVEDAKEILDLQKLAYTSEAEIIGDFTIPPLHQRMDEIIAEFSHRIFLKVELGGKIIGSVRAHVDRGTCYIGRLIVHPDHQNLGLGTRLLRAAEEQFRDSERYELFTGEKSEKNLYIYKRNGYQVFKSEVVSEKLTLVFLEKVTGKVGPPVAPDSGPDRAVNPSLGTGPSRIARSPDKLGAWHVGRCTEESETRSHELGSYVPPRSSATRSRKEPYRARF